MANAPHDPSALHRTFAVRVTRALIFATLIVSFSVLIGMLGYHYLENLSWLDAYVEAAMISAGMGPSVALHTTEGKFFAGTYALYSGLALIVAIGVVLGPIVHRVFHKWHLDADSRLK